MPAEVYLVHYLQQSCGWIKIAEYALAPQDVERMQAEIQARHPNDVLRFEVRKPRARFHTCAECEANFRLNAGEQFPPHNFRGKPCAGSGSQQS